jgi:hypothetical protein
MLMMTGVDSLLSTLSLFQLLTLHIMPFEPELFVNGRRNNDNWSILVIIVILYGIIPS